MTRRRLALRLTVAAAVVTVVGIDVLVAEYLIASRREAVEGPAIEGLEAEAKTDPAAAPRLEEARKRRAEASLARKARNRATAWVLLASGGVFVGCGRWYLSLRPRSSPALEALVADRFPPAESGGRRSKPPSTAPPSNLGPVEELIERFGPDREAAIPILQGIQQRYGFLPDDVLAHLCARTAITPAQVAGTSSFYARFRRSPVGRHVVRVCHGTACHVAGAEQITQELRRHLEIAPGQDTDARLRFTVDRVACLGCCSLAPVLTVDDRTAGRLTPADARRAVAEAEGAV